MRYIFAVILSLCLSSTSLAGAGAMPDATLDVPLQPSKGPIATYLKQLTENNILWLEGFKIAFSNPEHIEKIKADIPSTLSCMFRIDDCLKVFLEYAERSQAHFRRISGIVSHWGEDTDARAQKIALHSIINLALSELVKYAGDLVELNHPKNMGKYIPQNEAQTQLCHRDLQQILELTEPFAAPDYRADLAISRPIYKEEAQGPEGSRITFDDAARQVIILDGQGVQVAIPFDAILSKTPSVNIKPIESPTPSRLPSVALEIRFNAGLALSLDAIAKEKYTNFRKILERRLGKLDSAPAPAGKSYSAKPAAASEEPELNILASPSKKSPKPKAAAKGKEKTATTCGVATSGGASGSAAAAAVPSTSEALSPAAAGAGASGDDKGKLPQWLQEKTLALAAARPLPLPPLSSYASAAGASKAPSMDANDKAMLANLLKANGDRSFGEIQTANKYNWHNLKQLLARLGFTETRDNYEFIYNGNSIKLHYIHWAQHALDDKLLNIMFRQMANIGLTDPVLREILDIR